MITASRSAPTPPASWRRSRARPGGAGPLTEYSDEDAQRIADRGRDALIERLRPAFHETARAHADILKLEDAQIEEMIQRAADRADGLQWRRALASIATEELGMSLGEALTAPVVARAQELAGAPSYEEALAALGLEPVPERSGASRRAPGGRRAGRRSTIPPRAASPASDPAPELRPGARDRAPSDARTRGGGPVRGGAAATAPTRRIESRRVRGGRRGRRASTTSVPARDAAARRRPTSAESPRWRPASRSSSSDSAPHGLDIARKPGRVLGRLRWREIRTLEVQPPRGLRRRRRQDRAHLLIRTQHGDASFEVPGGDRRGAARRACNRCSSATPGAEARRDRAPAPRG